MLRYGPMGQILKELHCVSFCKNDYRRFQETDTTKADLNTITFQKKRVVDDTLVVARPSGANFASSAVAKNATPKKNWPILAINLPEKDLYDSASGIISNRDKKGRDWEKIAEVSYMEEGKLLFETYAGLRMHGGIRLQTKKWKPGFRLYFRKQYGMDSIAPGILLKNTEVPIRTLVLQTTAWPPGYPFNNPLAYDIAKKIGCLVPETRLVELYLNGKSYGMMIAVEHLSRRQWGQRYSSEDYNFYKFRSSNAFVDLKMYTKKLWETVSTPIDGFEETARNNIDLDNLSRHIFSWVYTGTTDFCQGVAFYDPSTPDAKLAWINWDMDHGFWDGHALLDGLDRENWQQSAFGIVYLKKHGCGRTKLFSRLIDESIAYKNEFINLTTMLLNHSLSQDFLQDRVSYYRDMLLFYGTPNPAYIDMLYTFMENRGDFIFTDMQTQFNLDGPYSCTIIAPKNKTFIVDGYTYNTSYSGKYFQSTPITIALLKEADRFHHWLINGKKSSTRSLSLHLTQNTTIEYIAN